MEKSSARKTFPFALLCEQMPAYIFYLCSRGILPFPECNFLLSKRMKKAEWQHLYLLVSKSVNFLSLFPFFRRFRIKVWSCSRKFNKLHTHNNRFSVSRQKLLQLFSSAATTNFNYFLWSSN